MCISKTSESTKRQLCAQAENKMVGGEAGNKISKLCAGHATKNVLGVVPPSLCGHTGMEKRQEEEAQKRNIFRHVQTKKCVYENTIVGGEAGKKISKLCVAQATKNVLEGGSTEPVYGAMGWRKG